MKKSAQASGPLPILFRSTNSAAKEDILPCHMHVDVPTRIFEHEGVGEKKLGEIKPHGTAGDQKTRDDLAWDCRGETPFGSGRSDVGALQVGGVQSQQRSSQEEGNQRYTIAKAQAAVAPPDDQQQGSGEGASHGFAQE